MSDNSHEMGWQPLAECRTPNQLLHFARLLRGFGMWDDGMRSLTYFGLWDDVMLSRRDFEMWDDGMWEELGQNQRFPPAASREVVENLKEMKVSSQDDQCPVCLKVCLLGETVKVLPCKHFFHSACILPWLHKTNSCPMCRHELPTDDEDYELYRKEELGAKQREEEIES